LDPDLQRYMLIVVLILFSAFFSASETAFSSVNIIRLRSAKDEGRKGAKAALFIAENFENTLSTILVGNNVVNIALSSIATVLFISVINPTYGPVVATVVSTVVVLTFGEILPKTFAKENAFAITLKVSWLLYFFYRLLAPIVFIFMQINRLFKKLFKNENNEPSVTEDELEVIFNTMQEEGVIQEEESEMMRNVLDLSDTTVYDIMTPRVDMVGVYVDDDIHDIKEIVFKEKYSRIPVYEESKDNVIGILYERDFFKALIETEDINQVNIRDIMMQPMFVTKSMRVDALIELLQRTKQHMVIVSDEYGGTSGVVTMEDCLEELVGEIYDEHDEEEFEIRKIDDNNYELNASIDLDDLFEDLELGSIPDTQYSNLGGWIYQELEEIPNVGDQFVYTNLLKIENDVTTMDDDQFMELRLVFTVKELQDRRMKTILLNIDRREVTKDYPSKGKKDKETEVEVENVEALPADAEEIEAEESEPVAVEIETEE